MSDDDLEKHAEIIRKLIEHEDNLQNFRLTWFSTYQALLFASLSFAWDKGRILVWVICGVGIVTAFSAFAALRLSDLSYVNLGRWWKKNLSAYKGPPRQGHEADFFLIGAMPSKVLPWIFMVSWLVLAIYRGYYIVPSVVAGPSSTSTHSSAPPPRPPA